MAVKINWKSRVNYGRAWAVYSFPWDEMPVYNENIWRMSVKVIILNQFCFEFSYLLGVTGTFIAILTPEFNDFDGWVMYVTYFKKP